MGQPTDAERKAMFDYIAESLYAISGGFFQLPPEEQRARNIASLNAMAAGRVHFALMPSGRQARVQSFYDGVLDALRERARAPLLAVLRARVAQLADPACRGCRACGTHYTGEGPACESCGLVAPVCAHCDARHPEGEHDQPLET